MMKYQIFRAPKESDLKELGELVKEFKSERAAMKWLVKETRARRRKGELVNVSLWGFVTDEHRYDLYVETYIYD